MDYVTEYDLYLVAIDETWPKSTDKDREAKVDLTQGEYILCSISMKGRKYSDIAL